MKNIQPRPSIKDWTKNEFIEEITSRVFNSEEQAEALFYTLLTPGRNLLLYGPGGYAKSMILEVGLSLVTPDFYKDVFMSTAAPGMSPDQFTGSLNVVKWKEDGIQEYNLDQTVFLCGSPYGILEEGLSAPPKVLLALRDALQRGFLCIHGTCTKNTLQNFFIPTNVYPDEWVKSLPKQEQVGGNALLDRFHRHVEVIWQDHTQATWAKFFDHQRGKDSLMAEMLGEAWQEGFKINPRSALQLFDEYEGHGLEACKNFRGVPKGAFEIFQKVEARAPYIGAIKKIEKFVKETAGKLGAEVAPGRVALQNLLVEQQKLNNEMRGIKIPSDTKYTERLQNLVRGMSELNTNLINAISTAPAAVTV